MYTSTYCAVISETWNVNHFHSLFHLIKLRENSLFYSWVSNNIIFWSGSLIKAIEKFFKFVFFPWAKAWQYIHVTSVTCLRDVARDCHTRKVYISVHNQCALTFSKIMLTTYLWNVPRQASYGTSKSSLEENQAVLEWYGCLITWSLSYLNLGYLFRVVTSP